MQDSLCEEVRPLLPFLASDEIEPADAARAERHLASCEGCRRHAEQLFRQDRALAELAAANLVDPLAVRICERLDGERPTVSQSASTNWIRTGLLVATAAALLLAVGLWSTRQSSSTADLARFVHFEGRITLSGDGETSVAVGSPLPPKALLTTVGDESFAVVRYDDGTQVTLAADTKLSFETDVATGAKRLVLQEGFLTADVAKQPAGAPMLLATPQAELVVLGTKFQLSGGSEATFVETSEGSVRVTRKSDGESVAVNGGFETSVSDVAGPLAAESSTIAERSPRVDVSGAWTGAYSPDGRFIAVTSYLRGEIGMWDVADRSGQFVDDPLHRGRITSVAFSSDGVRWVTGGADGTVHLHDLPGHDALERFPAELGPISDLSFLSDGVRFAALTSTEGSDDRVVTILDLSRDAPTEPLRFSAQRWTFSPNGNLLASYDRRAKQISIWDLRTSQCVKTFASPVGNNVFSLAISHDNATLAVDGSSGLVTFCDLATGAVRNRLERRGGRIFGMAFSPDDRTFATGHQDGTIRLIDVSTSRQMVLAASNRPAHVSALSFAPDGRTLLTREIRLSTDQQHRDGAVRVWDVPNTSQ